MQPYEIVAYTYAADTYCPTCIVRVVALAEQSPELVDGLSLDSAMNVAGSTELCLNAMAETLGVDRMNERSFDSGDFPKVIFADQIRAEGEYPAVDDDGGETCDRCGDCGAIILPDPFSGRPVGDSFNDPRVPCCGRDAADCDCDCDDSVCGGTGNHPAGRDCDECNPSAYE